MAAKRVFQANGWTPVAVADTVAMTAGGYVGIGALSASTALNITEIRLNGEAPASAVNEMMLARASTLGTGGATALATPNSDGPLNGLGQAPVQITYVQYVTTQPQRATGLTAARLNLAFNAFGGNALKQFAPGGEWGIWGVSVNVSDSQISTPTASPGRMASNIEYEPL